MSFKILYVTATASESVQLTNIRGLIPVKEGFRYGNLEIFPIVTGIGSISTAWAMKQWISVNEKPDLAINAGIAGSFSDDIAIGDVVMPETDCFADAGIENGENFLTMSEAGLMKADDFPFKNGLLVADNKYTVQMKRLLRPVRAITVNTVTGSDKTKSRLIKKYNPEIETMEGATFFYICAREKIPFLALRAISNKVEVRNRGTWNIELALEKLSDKLSEIVLTLE